MSYFVRNSYTGPNNKWAGQQIYAGPYASFEEAKEHFSRVMKEKEDENYLLDFNYDIVIVDGDLSSPFTWEQVLAETWTREQWIENYPILGDKEQERENRLVAFW